ncbi:hypothetical protein Dimus_025101 [Dionaea muscipula]
MPGQERSSWIYHDGGNGSCSHCFDFVYGLNFCCLKYYFLLLIAGHSIDLSNHSLAYLCQYFLKKGKFINKGSKFWESFNLWKSFSENLEGLSEESEVNQVITKLMTTVDSKIDKNMGDCSIEHLLLL